MYYFTIHVVRKISIKFCKCYAMSSKPFRLTPCRTGISFCSGCVYFVAESL